MTTIQILTLNNENTIQQCVKSLSPLNADIIIGDLGSSDNTVSLCNFLGLSVYNLGRIERDKARNQLAKNGINLSVEPWEILAQGSIEEFSECSYASILSDKIITKNIRLWKPHLKHINPTFEKIDSDTSSHSNLIFYSIGSRDYNYDKSMINKWKNNPMLPQPHYYESCIELSLGNYENFFKSAERYLFMDNSNSMPSIMLRYYMAYVYLTNKKLVRPSLQNINLCLCKKPLMSEFWCLMGDVYYHLLKDFHKSKTFYENATILGSRRKKNDTYPMDLSKYKTYPKKMIKSCDDILSNSSMYRSIDAV